MSASQVIRIRARNGQSERLGLRLQQLVEPGLEAPGCLEYQVRRDALEPDLWLVCSQWRVRLPGRRHPAGIRRSALALPGGEPRSAG
ncbi:antibiotic biosynthesis monooxygenase [Pseudomonas aeruginosa]|uniref:antibiotic biosynthesis monooxygenase family protein n=1 Tax=Pseudomonas aeruginosa TaxID=287 RepID=UPI001785F1AD|nr:antibiotic biosynthesis monooxygenase family protein [Pseudomonas aeruginosa]MCW5488159.1 antibiotic biosynthesis monooxygenase [Pseudomonas aeruginosa]